MVDPQQVIDESRPMLEEFLGDVGIYHPSQPIADVRLRDQFSDWIDEQEIREEDFCYLVSRVAAFICEYLIDGHNATRFIEGRHILCASRSTLRKGCTVTSIPTRSQWALSERGEVSRSSWTFSAAENGVHNQRLKLTGAAILVFRASTQLQAAPTA